MSCQQVSYRLVVSRNIRFESLPISCNILLFLIIARWLIQSVFVQLVFSFSVSFTPPEKGMFGNNLHGFCAIWIPCLLTQVIVYEGKKGKVFPYSLPSVEPGADPGVQAVSLQVT